MLCLLGPPAIQLDSHVEPLPLRPKALAVLAWVALYGTTPRAELATLIFPEAADPRAALRWHLAYLRAQLPAAAALPFSRTRQVVQLQIPTDVDCFRRGVRRLLQHGACPADVEVLALYRGDLCAGMTVSASAEFDEWLYVERDGRGTSRDRQSAPRLRVWCLDEG